MQAEDCIDARAFYYGGFEHRAKLKQRLGVQFNGGQTAAYYYKQNKPESVELAWPAAGRAVEAYVFHALLGAQQAGWSRQGAVGLCPLGGWIQKNAKMSPLSSLVWTRATIVPSGLPERRSGRRFTRRNSLWRGPLTN